MLIPAAASVLNVGLDLLFVVGFHWSLEGAGIATLISQIIAGVGLMIYAWHLSDEFRIRQSLWSWWAVPIGWFLADVVGFIVYKKSAMR